MHITFYSGNHCHLCDLAQQLLVQHADYQQLHINKVDVSLDHQTYHLYGARIPVLKREDNDKELAWPFDSTELSEFLS